jgi:hypothetical protein
MSRPQVSSKEQYVKYTIATLAIVLALAILVIGYKTYQNQQSQINKQKANFEKSSEAAAKMLAQNFKIPIKAVKDIEHKINNNDLDHNQIKQILKETLIQHPQLFGVGIAYAANEDGKLYAPYINTFKDGSYKYTDIAEEYNYTSETLLDDENVDNDWYINAIKQGPSWSEPYFDSINLTHVIEYDLPLYDKNKNVIAVIYANFSLKAAREMLFDIDLGKVGFGFVVTPKENILIHPNQKIMAQPFNEFLAKENADTLSQILNNNSQSDIDYIHEAYDHKNKQELWVDLSSIPGTPWLLVVVDNVSENLYNSLKDLEITLKILLFLAILLAICIAALWFKIYYLSEWRLFAFAFCVFSIFILGAITYPWTIFHEDEERGITPIYNQSTLMHYLENNDYLENPNHKYTLVPTGIFIQNLFFTAPSSIRVSAYVWHKYPLDAVDIKPGFIFPQQMNEKFDRLEFELEEQDYRLYVWHAILELEFEPRTSLFPFGNQILKIDLWAQDFHKYVIPIPDFMSYDSTSPKQQMGVDEDIFLKSWEINQSYFSYQDSNLSTNFGNSKFEYRNGIPQLSFNVKLHRKLLGPLVIYFLPLILVICCAYLSIMKWSLFKGESPYTILGFAATLLFVLSVSHVALRSVLNASLISYAEYCYLLGYLLTVLTAFNNLLYLNKANINFILYKNNLLPKLIFWPFVGLYVLIVTIVLFSTSAM